MLKKSRKPPYQYTLCPVTSTEETEGALPIIKNEGNLWNCSYCFYCDDISKDLSPRGYAIEKRRLQQKSTKTMLAPLDQLKTSGCLFPISPSIDEQRKEFGLPILPMKNIAEIDFLFNLFLPQKSSTQVHTIPSINKLNENPQIIKKKIDVENALFLGCLIPYRLPNYELSARNLLKTQSIQISDLPFACCGSMMTESYDELLWLTIGAYNLAIAEEAHVKRIISLCGGCTGTLRRINKTLLENPAKLHKVNFYLNQLSKSYHGSIVVEHLAEMLYPQLTAQPHNQLLDKEHLKNLKKLTVGVQIPCQIIRPKSTSPYANIGANILTDLLKITRVKIVHYPYETFCCGSTILPYNETLAFKIAKKRLDALLKRKVDAVVLGCGNCSMNLDLHQKEYSVTSLPTLFFTEILDYAFGSVNEKIDSILKGKEI